MAIVEYCLICDKLMPYDGNGHCYACESDSPTCELNDYNAPENGSNYDWSARVELIDKDYFKSHECK